MENKRGGISLAWGIVLIVIIIGIMIFTLWTIRAKTNTESTYDATTPDVQQNATDDAPKMFSDGLKTTHQTSYGTLDETGFGVSEQSVFYVDINQDNITDKIIRTHHETGTGHAWDEYNIQIVQNGQYIDITPNDFRTVVGADCALHKIQFVFQPTFHIVKISRPWIDSWITPSMATRTIYKLTDNVLIPTETKDLRVICDVEELFNHK